MHTATKSSDSPTAMAHVLAMIMATHPELDARDIRMLEALDAFKRLGMSEPAFLKIAAEVRNDSCRDLSNHNWLHTDDLEIIDEYLDQVHDKSHRLLLCRLASCIITSDGQVHEIGRMVYDHILAHWGYTRSSVSQAILAERVY